jgi:hypothetical protein
MRSTTWGHYWHCALRCDEIDNIDAVVCLLTLFDIFIEVVNDDAFGEVRLKL